MSFARGSFNRCSIHRHLSNIFVFLEIHMSIRLLVCDDHEVIRTGLISLLAGSDIEIIAEAANGKEAVEQAEIHRPDVILLDIRMPDGDGLSTLEKLRTAVPDSRVVMLSTYDNPTYIARAVALGASDYVLKGSTREAIPWPPLPRQPKASRPRVWVNSAAWPEP